MSKRGSAFRPKLFMKGNKKTYILPNIITEQPHSLDNLSNNNSNFVKIVLSTIYKLNTFITFFSM